MISISSKKLAVITKVSLTVLLVYTLFFITYRVTAYYKIYFEKERLTLELQDTKKQVNDLKIKVDDSKRKLQNLEESYFTKEEIEAKLKDIFSRMSLFDYQLNYIDAKKMCIDRYVLVVGLNAQSENGEKAAQGILSYLGNTKESETSNGIYFVDYVMKAKR